MKVYKLTNGSYKTKFDTQWGRGVTNRIKHHDKGCPYLCTPNWLHCYEDIRQLLLFRDKHVDTTYHVLWEAKAGGRTLKLFDKMGCTKLTTVRKIQMPKVNQGLSRRFYQLEQAAREAYWGDEPEYVQRMRPFSYYVEALGRTKFFELLNKHVPLDCIKFPGARVTRFREIKRVVGKVVRERKAKAKKGNE